MLTLIFLLWPRSLHFIDGTVGSSAQVTFSTIISFPSVKFEVYLISLEEAPMLIAKLPSSANHRSETSFQKKIRFILWHFYQI